MARISVEPRVMCDLCGDVFGESAWHGRLLTIEGFGDLSGNHGGELVNAIDICRTCADRISQGIKEHQSAVKE